MAPAPTVSVLMPVFNGFKYLTEAIDSIILQSFERYEFIIVDDGSTDLAPELLEEYDDQDDRIRVVTQCNSGVAGALNAGLAYCRGEFVFRMDGDDYALPGRFAAQLAEMQRWPECVALGTAVLFTDSESRPIKYYRPKLEPAEIAAELAEGNGGALVHPTVVFRRSALLACGGYREKYDFIEDLDLFVRLLEHGELRNLAEPLYHYRQHPQSVNYRLGNRDAQTAEIIAPLRARRGLPPWPGRGHGAAKPARIGVAECRRRWALEAVEGGNLETARANARAAVLRKPWSPKCWACFRYVYSRPMEKPR